MNINEKQLIKNITNIICESLPSLVGDKYVCVPTKDDKGMYNGCGWHTDPYHFIAGLASDYLFNLAKTTDNYWVLNYVQVSLHFMDIDNNDKELKYTFEASSSITSEDILNGKFKDNQNYLCNLIAKYLNTYAKGANAMKFRSCVENKDNTIRKITINKFPDMHQEFNRGGYIIDSRTRKFAVIDVYMDNIMTEEQQKAKEERDRIRFENSPEQIEKRRIEREKAECSKKVPELANPSMADNYSCKQMKMMLSKLRETYISGYAYPMSAYDYFDAHTKTHIVADFREKYNQFFKEAWSKLRETGWINPKTKSISKDLEALKKYYPNGYAISTYDNGLGESDTYFFFDEDGNIADIYDEEPVRY